MRKGHTMNNGNRAALVRLNDGDRILPDPAEDLRGRGVRDRDGDDLGKLGDLLIDEAEGKFQMLRVERGGVLAFGATLSFIPVEAITAIDADVVHMGELRERIAGAPHHDPDLIDAERHYTLYVHQFCVELPPEQ
jgi:sporulation protein YlmC with PRC-barrel domain